MFGWLKRKAVIPDADTSADDQNRRRVPHVCANCHEWHTKLVFMDNGLDYCVACAQKLQKLYGRMPAGKRDDDFKSLDDQRDTGPHSPQGPVNSAELARPPAEPVHPHVVFVRTLEASDDDF